MPTLALTGVSGSGLVGTVVDQQGPAQPLGLTVRAPVPRVALRGLTAASGQLAIALPTPRVAFTGTAPVVGGPFITAPMPRVAFTGKTAALGSLAIVAPMPRVALLQGGALALKAPTPRVALTGTAGAVGTLAVRAPVAKVALRATITALGTLAVVAPHPRVSLAGQEANVGRLAVRAPAPRLQLTGSATTVGRLAIVAPLPRIGFIGAIGAQGQLAVRSPVPRVSLRALAAVQTVALDPNAPNTIVMHTERLSLTQYTNYPFNSYAQFAGTYLGASDGGIYQLAGPDDAGVPIQSALRTGTSDFNTSHLKRVPRVYVGYRADARLILRIFTDEHDQRDYAINGFQAGSLHGAHARIGENVMARYWQFELRNERGGDFTLDMMELRPVVVRRRIGGRDA